MNFHYCPCLRHGSATWMLSAGSLGPRLLRNKKGMRPACRMVVLETPGHPGREGAVARRLKVSLYKLHGDPDIVQPFRCYQL